MDPHRSPLREIRGDYKHPKDRVTALHEFRHSETGSLGEEGYPRVTVHAAGKSAVSTDPPNLSPVELTQSDDFGLWKIQGQTRIRPAIGRRAVHHQIRPGRGRNFGQLSVYEIGIFELLSENSVQGKQDDYISHLSLLGNTIAKNVVALLLALSQRGIDDDVLAVATFSNYEDVILGSEFPRRRINESTIETPIVTFPSLDSDAGNTYTDHVTPIETLLKPLWQSAGQPSYEVEIEDEIVVTL